MGDTGSLALGGLVAGLAMLTRTELLMIVIGGLFVVEMLSVVLQIAVFRTTRRRLFRMAPFHHHFELAGLGGNHGHHPVLADRRDLLHVRARPVLHRVARRGRRQLSQCATRD